MNIQIRKFYYGDIPEESGGGNANTEKPIKEVS